jgi:CheY-like chemotaxis protein
MKILVLDDDETRLIAFRKKLIGHIVECVKESKETIRALENDFWDAVSLDHDLGGKVMVSSGPGTGYEVAQWLHDHEDRKPKTIIIHSFNPAGAKNMMDLLPGAIYNPGAWLLKEDEEIKGP